MSNEYDFSNDLDDVNFDEEFLSPREQLLKKMRDKRGAGDGYDKYKAKMRKKSRKINR